MCYKFNTILYAKTSESQNYANVTQNSEKVKYWIYKNNYWKAQGLYYLKTAYSYPLWSQIEIIGINIASSKVKQYDNKKGDG